MAKFHINPKTGDTGACAAVKDKCPFGGAEAHYENAADARQAFELSMAGKELKLEKKPAEKPDWDEWSGESPSGAFTKGYKDTTAFISRSGNNEFLAYGKGYDPHHGPSRHSTEAEAMAAVAKSFETPELHTDDLLPLREGDPLPTNLANRLESIYGKESYALEDVNGKTRLTITHLGGVARFDDVKVIDAETARKGLTDEFYFEDHDNKPMTEGEVTWTDSSPGSFVYVKHENKIFRGTAVLNSKE